MQMTKQVIGWFGNSAVAEIEVIEETHWIQMVGLDMIRCDDQAKETGWGFWSVTGPGKSLSWSGSRELVPGADKLFEDNWIREHHVKTYETEKDYS